jgi:hypothetical protein
LHDFERTRLWKTSLAPQAQDEYADERERLRVALLGLRENAVLAGQTIRQQLSELTVHDVTHADALWGIAEEIAGEEVSLNPVEAFVLGAAFYTHDLALGLAAFQEGPEALHAGVEDVLATRLFRSLGHWPSAGELAEADESERGAALFDVLRRQHAERAEELLKLALPHPDGHGDLYLLDNQDLRERYAGTIGVIAHSHGWEVDRLRHEFVEARGGPGWARQWGVDRLLVACLLRLADAANVDERRAPALLQALSSGMPKDSQHHWTFQRRLQPARRNGDRLEFSSTNGFPPREAPAWWLCYETLRMVDGELRQVDAMLSDLKRPRLAARSVAGVDAPARLTAYIAADGWEPVDAQVHVLDVAQLVRQLGGEELYGKDASVPLRELIQNGADAVRARRICEEREENYGTIVVRVGGSGEETGPWIEVEDDGLGMSLEVMRGALLSFGTSSWTSPALAYDLPRLMGRDFTPTGRYGIGFFSVFMWGEHVKVTTRRFDAGQADTRVLEFDSGVSQRPIIRPASQAERLRDGGTRVRVWLEVEMLAALVGKSSPATRSEEEEEEEERAACAVTVAELQKACLDLAPGLDVSIDVEAGGERGRALTGGDWLTMSADELYARTNDGLGYPKHIVLRPEVIREDTGEVVGRGALGTLGAEGIAVVGGLRATSISYMTGILLASPVRAARDLAMPLASMPALAAWATRQAAQAVEADLPAADLLALATTVRSLGGSVRALPLARAVNGLLGYNDVVTRLRPRDSIRLVDDAALSILRPEQEKVVLFDDVLVVGTRASIMIQYGHSGRLVNWPAVLSESRDQPIEESSMSVPIIEAAAEAWDVPEDEMVVASWGPEVGGTFGTLGSEQLFDANIVAIMRPGSRQALAYTQASRAMGLLIKHRSRTSSELASELGISSAALGKLLKPYVEEGWIKRVKGGYEQP